MEQEWFGEDFAEEEEKSGETGEEEIFYEPESLEEVRKFISSLIDIFIERIIPEKPVALTFEKAGKCLNTLGKIWNLSEYPPTNYFEDLNCGDCGDEKLMDMEGYVDDYQYLHIEAVDLALSDVKILPKHFVWLLSADFSGNRINNESACPITKLPNLVALRLNRNRFKDPYMPVMRHLQYLGLNNNEIKSLHRIYHPNLETLTLNYNLINKVDADDCWKLPKLKQLELRGNRLTTTFGIQYATLVNLYLAQNQITELIGLQILVNLERLHLRENPLSTLIGFSDANANLKYLNIRKCQISEVEEIQKLSVLKGLKELIIRGNVFNPELDKKVKGDDEDAEDDKEEEEEEEEEEEGGGGGGDNDEEKDEDEDIMNNEEREQLRLKILLYIPTLTRIDKKPVTKEERQNMRELQYDRNNTLDE